VKTDPTLEALIDQAMQETRTKMLRELADLDLPHATLDQIEEAVERVGSELQRSLQRRLVTERTHGPRDNTLSCPCGGRARYRKQETRRLTTRHGELTLSRPYYYCDTCHQSQVPLDHALGLDAGTTTTQVRLWIADLVAHASFFDATALLHRLTCVQLGVSTVERTGVAVGTALREAQQQAAARHLAGQGPAVAQKPKRLSISLDGTMTPLREPWKKDGSAGRLVCRYGECKTAVIYTPRPGPEGDEGATWRAYTATLGDLAQFARLVATVAHQAGHHFARELVVLADGSPWIWNLAAAQFPTALQILDFFHASQHLFALAHRFFGEETSRSKEWVRARQAELKEDQVGAVLQAIGELVPETEEQAKQQATEAGYFASNAERMRYGTFERKGYQIGSGVMEATCKQVVHQRLDQAGMHWRPETAEAVVALRAALLSTQPPDLRPYCRMAHP